MKTTDTSLNTNARRYALLGACFGLIFPIVAILVRTVGAGIPLSLSSIFAALASDPLLWIIATAPLFLGLFAAIAGRRQDELEKTNNILKARERELEATQLVLEERVNQRTRELTTQNQLFMERAQLLNSVVDTSRLLLTTLSFEKLLPIIVQTIAHHFNYSHARLYLLDEQKQHPVLMASSSEGDRQIMKSGQNPVEFAIRTGQAQIVKDAEASGSSLPGTEMTHPQVELVLPLSFAQIVIGALDLHADHEVEFAEEYVAILTILADLVAITIQNSIQYDKTQRTLQEAETISKQISAREWSSWMESIQVKGYRYDGIRAEPLREPDVNSSASKRMQNIPIRLPRPDHRDAENKAD